MNRVPYRRVTPPRDGSSRQEAHRNSTRYRPAPGTAAITRTETFVVQTVLSVLILAIVLIICLVDISPMIVARDGLRHVLAGAETVEEFTTSMRQFGENWLNITPSHVENEPYTLPLVYPAYPLTIIEEPPTQPLPGLWD